MVVKKRKNKGGTDADELNNKAKKTEKEPDRENRGSK